MFSTMSATGKYSPEAYITCNSLACHVAPVNNSEVVYRRSLGSAFLPLGQIPAQHKNLLLASLHDVHLFRPS